MLKAYSFDVDSNLFFTDTTIYLDKLLLNGTRAKIEVSQTAYEELIMDKEHYRHVQNDIEQSMANFKRPWIYEKAIFDAISNGKFWPSYPKYIEAIRSASPIQKNTARGNSVQEIRATDKRIIHEVLSDSQREDLVYSMKERLGNYKKNDDFYINEFLNNNLDAPCSNTAFLSSIHKDLSDSMPSRKNAAFEQFVLHIKNVFSHYYGANFLSNRKIRLGFSDDTHKNIEWFHNFIYTEGSWLMWKYPEVLFRLYDAGEMTLPPKKLSYKNHEEEM